jgi:hypothetical protein
MGYRVNGSGGRADHGHPFYANAARETHSIMRRQIARAVWP